MVLQPPPRAPERIVDGERQVRIALIRLRRTGDIDFTPVGKREPDVDLVEPGPMVSARTFDHDAAGGYAAVALFQLADMRLDRLVDRLSPVHALEIDFDGRFHVCP